MRFIPVNVHNILEYIFGMLTAMLPWLLDFTGANPETYTMIAAGAAVILIALYTNYKYSLAKIIAFNTNLTLEIIIGVLLAASPWILGFNTRIFIPHLTMGILLILISLMSEKFINYRPYS